MQKIKMSLANIQGKLNRNEMKNIMAGWDGSFSTEGCKKDGSPCGKEKTCKATTTDCTCGGSGGDNPDCMIA